MILIVKLLFFSFLFLFCSGLLASENCHDLIRPFFNQSSERAIINKTSKMDITKFGLVENAINREKFERIYAQCLSPGKSELKTLANKRLNNINYSMMLITTAVGYTNNNWDKTKDMEWFEKLGYSIVYSAFLGKIYGKIVKDNGGRFNYLIKDYLFSRVAFAGFFGGSMLLFEQNKAEKKKFEELKKSPHFNEEMKKLKAYTNDTLVARYQTEVITYLSQQKIINLGIGVHEGIDFDNLRPSDLDDPEIQKVVLAAIISQEYQNRQGAMAVTGSQLDDFVIYDSLYSIVKIPKEIFVNKMINQVMCLNSHNPTRGIMQAVGISALNQILFADYYGITYKVLRKKLIDQ